MSVAEHRFPEEEEAPDARARNSGGNVVLGDDWVTPNSHLSDELRDQRERRGLLSLRRSPLTRKIITFNLIALILLIAGSLYLNSSRESLVLARAGALVSEAELIADVFEAQIPSFGPINMATGDGVDVAGTLDQLSLRNGVDVFVFDTNKQLVGRIKGTDESAALTRLRPQNERATPISDVLTGLWHLVTSPFTQDEEAPSAQLEERLVALIDSVVEEGTRVDVGLDFTGRTVFAAVTAVYRDNIPVGVVAVASPSGSIDALVRGERERNLQMFVVAILISIGLSLVLASTIANPLADLAEAAELGRDKDSRKVNPGRIRIPDLSARPDEIGRLSRALRGMVSALYNRIEGNEQFAADVSHEIKNPLASLQSAVGTMRMVSRDDQRERLLDVIEHDVRRLDRLVSDISNASRLDAELVKEEEEPFDLVKMLTNLNQYLGEDAQSKGIEFITDLPEDEITVQGLEARLAQVFVNLITNAISFCENGDAIRIWVRRRENRVLVVVEDTGPGIPDQALNKIFKRFYSQRPAEHFGNNSGLGLAISRQIVEAHGGVIWAENIRPTEADLTSEPLGARFVVGLPV